MLKIQKGGRDGTNLQHLPIRMGRLGGENPRKRSVSQLQGGLGLKHRSGPFGPAAFLFVFFC